MVERIRQVEVCVLDAYALDIRGIRWKITEQRKIFYTFYDIFYFAQNTVGLNTKYS